MGTEIPLSLRARVGRRDILRRHVAPLEIVSVDVPEAALECLRSRAVEHLCHSRLFSAITERALGGSKV